MKFVKNAINLLKWPTHLLVVGAQLKITFQTLWQIKRNNKTENKALKEKKEKGKQKEKQKSRNNFSTNDRGYAPFKFPFPRQPFQFGIPRMSGPRFPIGCFHCGKPNHQRKDCPELKPSK